MTSWNVDVGEWLGGVEGVVLANGCYSIKQCKWTLKTYSSITIAQSVKLGKSNSKYIYRRRMNSIPNILLWYIKSGNDACRSCKFQLIQRNDISKVKILVVWMNISLSPLLLISSYNFYRNIKSFFYLWEWITLLAKDCNEWYIILRLYAFFEDGNIF